MLTVNANGCPALASLFFCCGTKCNNVDMIEFEMSPPKVYNCCGCEKESSCYWSCCECTAQRIRVSTDDYDRLAQHLQEKNVSGVELLAGSTETINP